MHDDGLSRGSHTESRPSVTILRAKYQCTPRRGQSVPRPGHSRASVRRYADAPAAALYPVSGLANGLRRRSRPYALLLFLVT
jgi:hypothetical protein